MTATPMISKVDAIKALRKAIDMNAETHIKIWRAYIACLEKEEGK